MHKCFGTVAKNFLGFWDGVSKISGGVWQQKNGCGYGGERQNNVYGWGGRQFLGKEKFMGHASKIIFIV